MEKADETLKKAAESLERYRKNKTMVPPEDLQCRYKVPFQKLKEKLKGELQDYLRAYCFDGIRTLAGDWTKFAEECNRVWLDSGYPKKVGAAVFKDFDLAEFQKIARDYREDIRRIWEEYFYRHTCLYIYGNCFAEENPHTPLIYNNLADKFWDDAAHEWIVREKPPGEAVLMFIDCIRREV